MSKKQELLEYIAALTPEQVNKLWSQRDKLERELSAVLGRTIHLTNAKET